MKIRIPTFMYRLGYSVKKHLPTILSITGCVGVPVTAFLSSRATLKAKKVLDDQPEDSTFMDDFKAVAKYYIWPSVSGLITMGSIVGANAINLNRNATLAAVGAAMAERLVNFRNKVIEEKGEEALIDIDKRIAEEKIKKDMDKGVFPRELDDDEFFIYEPLTESLFVTTNEKLNDAERLLNYYLRSIGQVSVNDFVYLSGGDANKDGYGGYIGWCVSNEIQQEFWQGWQGFEWIDWVITDTDQDIGKIKTIYFRTEALPLPGAITENSRVAKDFLYLKEKDMYDEYDISFFRENESVIHEMQHDRGTI